MFKSIDCVISELLDVEKSTFGLILLLSVEPEDAKVAPLCRGDACSPHRRKSLRKEGDAFSTPGRRHASINGGASIAIAGTFALRARCPCAEEAPLQPEMYHILTILNEE